MLRAPSRSTWREANRRAARSQAEWRKVDSRDRHSALRRLGFLVALVVVALGIAGVSSLSTLRSAKDQLTRAKDLLETVADDPSSLLDRAGRSADLTRLRQATELSEEAHHALASSPAVDYIGLFPYLHTQTSGALGIASDAARASRIAAGLVGDVDTLAATASISHGRVPLPPLASLQEDVARAARQMSALDTPSSGIVGLVGSLQHARDLFDETDERVGARLTNAAEDLVAAQQLLGADGPRTYLVVGENNAEMRDQGIPLSYATVSFDSGSFTHSASADTGSIEPATPVSVAIPPGTNAAFGQYGPTSLWQVTNATADFPWSASVMAAMFERATGQKVNGVIAADVPALAQVLSVTGPVSVPGISTPIDSSNVAQILLNQLYANAPASSQQTERHDEVAAAISAVFSTLQGGSTTDVVDFTNALAKAAAGRHLLLWSTDPSTERIFEQTGLAGNVAGDDPSHTMHLAIENETATKLDYFIHPTVDVDVSIEPHGTAVVTTRVDIDNQAPVGAKPSYQLGPDNITSFTPGEYVALVCFWGPAGDVQPGSVRESGLQLQQATTTVYAGQQSSVAFSYSIPNALQNGTFHLRFVPQPRLYPDQLNVNLVAPTWKLVSGQRQVSMAWDTTSTLEWGLVKE